MNWITTQVKRFFCKEDGVTAIEYGLIAALIGVSIIVAVGLVGDQLVILFGQVVTALTVAI